MKRRGEKRAGVGSARTAVGASANGSAVRAQCLGRPARPLAALAGHVVADSMLHTVDGFLNMNHFFQAGYFDKYVVIAIFISKEPNRALFRNMRARSFQSGARFDEQQHPRRAGVLGWY